MYETTYHRPKSLAEAASLFSSSGDAAYISGGHTLLPAMKARLAAARQPHRPAARAGAEGHPGERRQRHASARATTHREVSQSADVKGAIPTLAALAGSIGDPQVRHLGTIGGSVANNDPAADYPSAVLALAGTVHTNKRQIAADEYFTGLYTTALRGGRDRHARSPSRCRRSPATRNSAIRPRTIRWPASSSPSTRTARCAWR